MSAIPGFGGDLNSNIEEDSNLNKSSVVEINGQSEWRFEVPFRTIMKLKVVNGIGKYLVQNYL